MQAFLARAAGDDPRHRPDRQRQDLDALHRAQLDQVADQQHHHARRPDRVPARRASTRCRSTPKAGRDLRQRPAIDAAPGSERHPGRRDPRPGDRRTSRCRRRRPATCCSARCTPTTRRPRSRGCSTSASQPFLVASSLIGIVAQRLVRRPCPACAVPQAPSAETIEKVGGAVAAAGRRTVGRRARLREVRHSRASRDGSRFTKCSRSTTRCAT